MSGDQPYYPGLEGVIAGETSIATIEGGLQYRGFAIADLARESTFLETAYLLRAFEEARDAVMPRMR